MFCLMYSFIACQYIHTQPDLENGYPLEVLAQLKFGRVRTQYTYGKLYIHVQASPVKIQTPIHWNQIGQSMATPPAVLPPSSISPPPLSHCVLIPTRNNLMHISKMLLILLFSCFFEILQVWNCLTCNCVSWWVSIYSRWRPNVTPQVIRHCVIFVCFQGWRADNSSRANELFTTYLNKALEGIVTVGCSRWIDVYCKEGHSVARQQWWQMQCRN
jgi:hypothetical protein